MEVKTVALIIFSCIVCMQVASGYKYVQDGYANFEIQSPRKGPASVQQTLEPLRNAEINVEKVMEAHMQISHGSELFASKFLQWITNALSRLNLNFIVSPCTVWSLLVMIAEGADGNTRKQLETVLHLPPEFTYVRSAYKEYLRELNVSTSLVELMVNRAVFTDINRPIYKTYSDILEHSYEADQESVNFRDVGNAIKSINDYIRQETRGKIDNIVRETDLKDAQVLLTSAIYFKGQWTLPFNTSFTTREPFYDETGNLVENVSMMHQAGDFPAALIPQLNATVLELSYGADDRLSMLLLLPYKGQLLSAVFANLIDYNIDMILTELHKYDNDEEPEENEVELSLPRFKIKSDLKLNPVLKALGITDLFNVDLANLTKMTRESIFVSSVLHKAFIEVNEEGTEAAAAAGSTLAFKQHPTAFNCNRPFGFLIVEKSTKTLVLSGVVRQPNLI